MHTCLELPIELATETSVWTAEERAVFARLETDGDTILPVLGGGDLCMLGGPRSPFFWEPLAAQWRNLPQADRNEYMKVRASRLTEDGDLVELLSGGAPAVRYAASPELAILLAAYSRPTFVITSHFSSREPPLSLFALGGEAGPVHGMVMAFRMKGDISTRPKHVVGVYAHILTTEVRAAEHLAKWVIRPAPVPRCIPRDHPRLVSLFGRDGEGTPAAELSVLGNGTTAQVAGLGVSGELSLGALRTVLQDLLARGTAMT